MGRKPAKKRPSFFKIVCREDFTRLLRLPPLFMQRYGSNFPNKVTLRIESGKTWDVKVGPMEEEDDLFCFYKGWNVFSKDVGLKFGQFLVFILNDNLFDVSIYETTGCMKEFQQHSDDDDDDEEDFLVQSNIKNHNAPEKARAKPSSSKESSPLYYEIVLSRHHKSRITPKRKFARAAGLMGNESVEVVGEHSKQCVTLDHSLKDPLRVDMTQGWAEFRTANLVYGKTYSLEFKPKKNLIKVMEVKN